MIVGTTACSSLQVLNEQTGRRRMGGGAEGKSDRVAVVVVVVPAVSLEYGSEWMTFSPIVVKKSPHWTAHEPPALPRVFNT
jgi:hypothetical protein